MPINALGAFFLLISLVAAAPPFHLSRLTTHHVQAVGQSGLTFSTFHPPVVYETYGTKEAFHSMVGRGIDDVISSLDVAKSFLESRLGLNPGSIAHISGHSSEIAAHEYFSQLVNGIPVANAVANVALVNGAVVSYGTSFVNPTSISSTQPVISVTDAILAAEQTLGGQHNDWPTSLEYFSKDDGSLILVHVIQIESAQTGDWFEAFVDASNGEMVNAINFVADASYLVVPFNVQDLEDDYSVQLDPADQNASPRKWHTYNGKTHLRTDGNNVLSYYGKSTNTVDQSSKLSNYNYRYDPSAAPGTPVNTNASRVNAFYTANMLHDYTYSYGFTESAFNFQKENYGKGGVGMDRVHISIQDPSRFNNANFGTPPDGQPGRMRMYIWNFTSPFRDSAMKNDVIAHEYGHGVSNRLTGGGTGRCLQVTESRALGEGWSDTLARLTEITSADDVDFTLGAYLKNNVRGIRTYPYSTNMVTNPLTYASTGTRTKVYGIGEVWAVIWHEIIASLLKQYGYSADKNNAAGKEGNIVAMHLFIDSLKIQPCNPTFINARDAILQADVNRYRQTNKCLLWRVFAKRGLGTGAKSDTKADNFEVPPGC